LETFKEYKFPFEKDEKKKKKKEKTEKTQEENAKEEEQEEESESGETSTNDGDSVKDLFEETRLLEAVLLPGIKNLNVRFSLITDTLPQIFHKNK
jgi:hypothetical protein